MDYVKNQKKQPRLWHLQGDPKLHVDKEMEGFIRIAEEYKEKPEDIKGVYERVKAVLKDFQGKTIKQFLTKGQVLTDVEAAVEARDFYAKLFKASPGQEAPEPD